SKRDWSSDVCSSDLEDLFATVGEETKTVHPILERGDAPRSFFSRCGVGVASFLRDTRGMGDTGGVRAPGRFLRTQGMLGDPPRLTAVGGQHVDLWPFVLVGA